MQSEMEKSSSLSALRQRVRDGVAESDFAGLARLVTHRGVWQAVAADPISCAYMAPVWAYGLAPAPGVDIFGRLERWCPALPAADYALGILYADGLCLPRNVHLARYHLQQGWQTEHSPLGGTSCWWVFSVHCTGCRIGPRRRRGVPVQIRLGRTAGEIRVGVYLKKIVGCDE